MFENTKMDPESPVSAALTSETWKSETPHFGLPPPRKLSAESQPTRAWVATSQHFPTRQIFLWSFLEREECHNKGAKTQASWAPTLAPQNEFRCEPAARSKSLRSGGPSKPGWGVYSFWFCCICGEKLNKIRRKKWNNTKSVLWGKNQYVYFWKDFII